MTVTLVGVRTTEDSATLWNKSLSHGFSVLQLGVPVTEPGTRWLLRKHLFAPSCPWLLQQHPGPVPGAPAGQAHLLHEVPEGCSDPRPPLRASPSGGPVVGREVPELPAGPSSVSVGVRYQVGGLLA